MLNHSYKKHILFVIISSLFFPILALSNGDLSKQTPITISVNLSDKNNSLKFFPNNIQFETGKLYRLVLKNAGTGKHYFSSDKFSQSIFTRKVQILDSAGKTITEVKGHIREVEIYPDQTAEWWFVPVKTGSFDDLKCVIPGHAEAGMVGKINIQ